MTIGVFVFTDIAGSTSLWASWPDAMDQALIRHDAILAEALTAAGGSVFKHTGDGMCASFASARDAIDGAAAAQRLLTSTDWGEIGRITVRMAVHAGEANRRGDDWFGPALNRTARLMGVAHGGQVVVSSAVVELAHDALPPLIGLKDLGIHRLRDLTEPEHVWQLVGEGLIDGFPALRSLDRFRGNLPTVPTSFLGREAEVDELGARLLEHRLITLVGPGGVGKTRLALQTAATVVDKFPEGAWFVDLARLADGSALDHATATTLGLTPQRDLTERQVVLDAVHTWQALVVIDNCEHLLTTVATFVADLLVAAPSVVVLATTREPLHISGEQVWSIEPLPIDGAAAQLFIERASAVRADFVADGRDESVRAICDHLDGMPLALELAAARMRSMTSTELLGRLDRRFRLLGANSSPVVAGRHASLQATVDWSFDLLDQESRHFFTRLSVFPAAFDLAAAHAIGGADDDLTTLDLLDSLVDKSLVAARQAGAETRYRLLETMREYGRTKLPTSELDQMRLDHARYFAEFTGLARGGMRGPEDVAWVRRVDERLDDIRAAVAVAFERQDADLALRLIAGLEPYNQPRRNAEIWSWAEAALALPNAEQHPLAVTACVLLAFGGHARDNPAETSRWGSRAIELHTALRLPPDPRPHLMKAYGAWYQGLLEEGLDALAVGDAVAESIGPAAAYDLVEARYQSVFASTAFGTPDVTGGWALVELAARHGNLYNLVRAKTALGVTLADSEPETGCALLDEALELAHRPDPPYWTGSTRVFAAAIRPDPREAIERLAASLEEYHRAGTEQWIRRSLRDFLSAFGALGANEAVALIDGSAVPFTTRPAAGEAAVAAAQHLLGRDRYDELKAEGAALSSTEVPDMVRAQIGSLLATDRAGQ